MRLGIRAKQTAAVTAIVGASVVALSGLYVTRLSSVVLRESQARGELLANAIFHRAREVVTGSAEPYAALRADSGLRAILESSIYGQSVTGADVLDSKGVVVASADSTLEGQELPLRGDLVALAADSPLEQLRVIYSGDGRTLELRQPMLLGNEKFGSIRVGVSTLLMRRELNALLGPALFIAASGLLVSVFIAALLARMLLRPIHVIRGGLTRLGRGEFGVTLDLPPGDEFSELGTFFNTVSQQLSADRTALVGQKANLQSAVEHIEDAVALFNPSGELLFSNPAMQPTLPADAIGRALQGLLPGAHPYRALVEETLATRESRGPIQTNLPGVPHLETEGDTSLLLKSHAIRGTAGELVGVLLEARNVAYLSRVQSTVAYSRKLVALGRLTAGIAHEVKNPLNAMMIHLELLRTKIRGGVFETVPEGEAVATTGRPLGLSTVAPAAPLPAPVKAALDHAQVIEQEIRRLDEVVQGFLKFTRPEDLRLQPVKISDLLEELVPLVEPEARKNNVRVTLECNPSAPSVNGDAAKLRQAFLNLAINACQAMPNGGTLRLSCSPTSRHRVEVRVEDTGIGIPPENLGKIFDLYFTTKDDGTGIGLSMVYRIVQMHDGDVEVQSTPGRGTTFRVLLPRATQN